ncbi:MAG: rhodanese-like domain-containing protein, partial [Paludibacteraceae bacterium]
INISGGHTSIQRQERAVSFKNIKIDLLPVENKSLEDKKETIVIEEEESIKKVVDYNSPLIVDVRTSEEFHSGAYPGAINIPLDELMNRFEEEIGDNANRDITVYCASGARSAYAQRVLSQIGYARVKNGGGLMHMMMRKG